MKIEADKAYRTRGGWKAVVKYDTMSSNFIVDHGGDHDGTWIHQADGKWFGDDEKYRKFDLISEWTDEPAAEPAPKYRAGDLVTIRLSAGDENYLNAGAAIEIRREEIISHTPAPEPAFDWKDVKPGMAFKHKIRGTVLHYVGPDMDGVHLVMQEGKTAKYDGWPKSVITRAPEHDIEVVG